MTNDVKQFRWREALVVLSEISKALKAIDPNLEITCCVHATQIGYYVSEYRGYDNWDMVGACPYFDVFSTTICNWALPEDTTAGFMSWPPKSGWRISCASSSTRTHGLTSRRTVLGAPSRRAETIADCATRVWCLESRDATNMI